MVEAFFDQKKVIAGCCWTPVLLSYILGKHGVEVTLGKKGEQWPYQGSIDTAQNFGAKVKECTVDEVCVDTKNKIVTSPAFMYEGQYHEVFDGIQKMVSSTLELTK